MMDIAHVCYVVVGLVLFLMVLIEDRAKFDKWNMSDYDHKGFFYDLLEDNPSLGFWTYVACSIGYAYLWPIIATIWILYRMVKGDD